MSATSIEARLGSAVGRCSFRCEEIQPVERADHGVNRPGRHLCIECCIVELGMPKQDLDNPDVGAILQKVSGEAVA